MNKPSLAPLAPILLLAACGAAEQQPLGPSPTEAAAKSAGSNTAAASVERTEYDGIITSRRAEYLPAPFTGRVKRLEVAPGQRVRAGDRIALFDDTDLKDKIKGLWAEEKAQLASGGEGAAAAGYSAGQLKHALKLRSMGAISGQRVAQIRSEMTAAGARSGVGGAGAGRPRADRQTLERKLANAQLVAPRDGVVMMVRAKEGAVANEGDPVARIFDPSDLIVRFAVPKAERTALRKGGTIELSIEGTERRIWATITDFADEEAPINLITVNADIDDTKLGPDEVRLASAARVRFVAQTAQR